MALYARICDYAALSREEHDAIVRLALPRFADEIFPTLAAYEPVLGIPPEHPEFAARRTALLEEGAVSLRSYDSGDGVCAIFATTPAGDREAVALMRSMPGRSDLPIGATIGSPTSTLPTHRVLQGFTYHRWATVLPDSTPESAVAEFGRLAVAGRSQLRDLLAAGMLRQAEADWIMQHARDAVLAGCYDRDQARPDPPVAYVFNTRPRLAAVLASPRKGLPVLPLFLDGAEPTTRILTSQFHGPYYRRWAQELGELAPAEVRAAGTAAVLRWLIAQGDTRWQRLPAGLPYFMPANAAMAVAMARLRSAWAGQEGEVPLLIID